MPIVTIENAGVLSPKQKKGLIARLTDEVAEITEKPKNFIYIRIDEVPPSNFGIAGRSLDQ